MSTKKDPWYKGWWVIPIVLILLFLAWRYRGVIMGWEMFKKLKRQA